MRELVVGLDAIAALAEAAGGAGRVSAGAGLGFDPGAAATLAGLAGADAVRVGLREELRPISESDVQHLRRVARGLELRIPLAHGLLKPALEARPDRVLVSGESWDRAGGASPLDLRTQRAEVTAIVRALDEAGIEVSLLVAPELDPVKAAHGLGVSGVELYTTSTVDLPASERPAGLEQLGDAARLATKLRLEVSLGGALDERRAGAVLEAAPSARRLCFGRAFTARALLVGVDRAVRDLRARFG